MSYTHLMREPGDDAIANLSQTDYSYGLRFTLDAPELDKLGLDMNAEPGDELHFKAVACVCRVRRSDDGENCVELQITHMDILQVEKDDEDDADSEDAEEYANG